MDACHVLRVGLGMVRASVSYFALSLIGATVRWRLHSLQRPVKHIDGLMKSRAGFALCRGFWQRRSRLACAALAGIRAVCALLDEFPPWTGTVLMGLRGAVIMRCWHTRARVGLPCFSQFGRITPLLPVGGPSSWLESKGWSCFWQWFQ